MDPLSGRFLPQAGSSREASQFGNGDEARRGPRLPTISSSSRHAINSMNPESNTHSQWHGLNHTAFLSQGPRMNVQRSDLPPNPMHPLGRNDYDNYIARLRDLRDSDMTEFLTPGAATFLNSLPIVTLAKLPENNKECAICFESYRDLRYGEQPVRLPCRHIVGKECLTKWVSSSAINTKRNACPFCRTELFECYESFDEYGDLPSLGTSIPEAVTGSFNAGTARRGPEAQSRRSEEYYGEPELFHRTSGAPGTFASRPAEEVAHLLGENLVHDRPREVIPQHSIPPSSISARVRAGLEEATDRFQQGLPSERSNRDNRSFAERYQRDPELDRIIERQNRREAVRREREAAGMELPVPGTARASEYMSQIPAYHGYDTPFEGQNRTFAGLREARARANLRPGAAGNPTPNIQDRDALFGNVGRQDAALGDRQARPYHPSTTTTTLAEVDANLTRQDEVLQEYSRRTATLRENAARGNLWAGSPAMQASTSREYHDFLHERTRTRARLGAMQAEADFQAAQRARAGVIQSPRNGSTTMRTEVGERVFGALANGTGLWERRGR